MAGKFRSKKEHDENIAKTTASHKENIKLIDEELNSLNSIFDLKQKSYYTQLKANEQEEITLAYARERVDTEQKGQGIRKDNLRKLNEAETKNKKILNTLKKQDEVLKSKLARQQAYVSMITSSYGVIKNETTSILKFFMASDLAMKNLTLELGLSGERSAILRDNMIGVSSDVANLGVSMEHLAKMSSIYSEETGRVRIHSKENLKSISLIAEGTNLGAEGAARMAGQYEMMGMNATDTASEVQRIVDTTERMGVNTSKVLKAVNKNFKKLQKYNFRGGVKGMADMAIYSEKFKINMDEVFSAMEKGRALDSVIEMSAQLQVLGGQFANLADPMSMLFESRNDPEAYTKRINEMTKGMVVMNKTASGFNLEIASPMAQDQLAQAAKALGMTTDELTTQAFRMREIQQTRSQMFSKGFTNDEKEVIEGLAKFNTNTGTMMVNIGGVATDVSKLTTTQVAALKQEQSTLKERTLASQTFDEAFTNTILSLKSALLPVLNGINSTLEYIRPTVISLTEAFASSGWLGKSGMLFAGTLLLAGGKFLGAIAKMRTTKFLERLSGGGNSKNFSGTGGGTTKDAVSKGAGGLKGAGKGGFGAGAGIGAAGLGIGAGIGIAAVGISKLAESMAKLDSTQIWALPVTVLALAAAFAAFTPAIIAVGGASTVSALGLLALGGAVLGIGAGIGIAATGIGYMAEGLAKLDGVNLDGIGMGLLSISAAALAGTVGFLGLAGMTGSVLAISASADGLERVGNAFYNIGAVLKGNASQFKEVKDTIQAIASTEMGSGSAIANLASIMSKPLIVQFDKKDIAFTANIDLTMDGNKFKTWIAQNIPATHSDLQNGTIGAG